MKKTVVFDFDGVIHSYKSGWRGKTVIPDPPVDGIVEALKEIHESGYEIVVVSTRSATVEGKAAVWSYLIDRAICFDGHPETLLQKIQSFKPWNA